LIGLRECGKITSQGTTTFVNAATVLCPSCFVATLHGLFERKGASPRLATGREVPQKSRLPRNSGKFAFFLFSSVQEDDMMTRWWNSLRFRLCLLVVLGLIPALVQGS
jgi:hypothetical protein